MTPYEIGVMLHYYCRVGDHEDMLRDPPVWRPTIAAFLENGLLIAATSIAASPQECYAITEKGRAYVEALERVGLPTMRWVVERETTTA